MYKRPDPIKRLENDSNYEIDTRPLCGGVEFVLTDAAHPRLVLKYGNHFLVLNNEGFIPACNSLGYGYYYQDTRHLSQWELLFNEAPLSVLSESVEGGYSARFLYSNVETDSLSQQKVIVQRETTLHERLWERITLDNVQMTEVNCQFQIVLQSDFADIFEIRGINRGERGKRMIPTSSADGYSLFLAYRGLDEILLETILTFSGIKPTSIEDGLVSFELNLPGKTSTQIQMCVSTSINGATSKKDLFISTYKTARKTADDSYKDWRAAGTIIKTDNELFNICLEQSFRDCFILRQTTPTGTGIAAGVPWFCALFGRDAALIALQLVSYVPSMVKEIIEVLAAYQGTKHNDYSEERPGRILHELRLGELARTGFVPHSPYYGSVDATQLWLILISEYINWTGDLEFLGSLWEKIELAISFLEKESTNGFIFYQRTRESGIENQGWKDSWDSMVHSDGSLATAPIAVCEAQAYMYLAIIKIAGLAEKIGRNEYSSVLKERASNLKKKFNQTFWMEDESFIALALDRNGNQLQSLTSNAGQCLFTGILEDDKANLVANRILGAEFFSGWGIRTLANSNLAYNPIGYHTGTVWPHDNALIAQGLRNYRKFKDVHKIMRALFEVAQHRSDLRLPELFCGFDRQDNGSPINYPVSCCPQAFATGSLPFLLSTCISYEPDASNNVLRINEPLLPDWLGDVSIQNLKIGNSIISLNLRTTDGTTSCQLLSKKGDVRLIFET